MDKNRRIKIAYILTPITFGGIEKVSRNYLENLNADCFEVDTIVFTRPWEKDPFFVSELSKTGYKARIKKIALHKIGGPLSVAGVAWNLLKLIKAEKYEVLHTHGYFADICGTLVSRILNIPLLATCHGYICSSRKLSMYIYLDKFALRFVKRIIAVSQGIKDELVKSGINEKKIKVLPNAVGVKFSEITLESIRSKKRAEIGVLPNEFLVGYVGRLSLEKGVSYLIDAVLSIRKSLKFIKIVIIGEGPERYRLERMTWEDIENFKIFTGFQKDVEKWFPAMDLFILPSLTEGTPMALLEAMAHGIPVIATSVGGIPKVITNNVNGMMVPPADSNSIKEAIMKMMQNHGERNRFGEAARKTIERKYNLKKWTQNIEEQYTSMVNQ